MVKLNKIYTRTGDDGTTGLVNGPRRLKADLRVEAYGAVDEANAAIGVARLRTSGTLDAMLENIQNDLFDLGADLATPQDSADYESLRIVADQVLRLENDIDALNNALAPLTSFVLPGGSDASAALHLARTIARRAERVMVALHQHEDVGQSALSYINRLSDFLFVAARHANDDGKQDVLWIPGKNR
ncbi:cob(I)yrinic acid a,c-diamide adenosyltransferase [Bartonella sp. LJL80]